MPAGTIYRFRFNVDGDVVHWGITTYLTCRECERLQPVTYRPHRSGGPGDHARSSVALGEATGRAGFNSAP